MFLADNTSVEWSRAAVGIEGSGPSFLTTSHMKQREAGMIPFMRGQLSYYYNLRIYDHSHPNHSTPSGLDTLVKYNKEVKDIQAFRAISDTFGAFGCNVIFRIYHEKEFHPYKLPPKQR